MQIRKESLENGQIYHILNRSIAGYEIFNCDDDYLRFIESIRYYQRYPTPIRYSELKRLSEKAQNQILQNHSDQERIVEIIAYCIMPTHIHLILKQIKQKGISSLMSNIENSYARYFNTKHKRHGPLWSGRFKNVLVQDESQLYHLTRYLHLNPTSSNIVKNPSEWKYSSYNEFVSQKNQCFIACDFKKVLDIKPSIYREFVEKRISYQKQISKIKKLIID